jgi:hypothetical protein
LVVVVMGGDEEEGEEEGGVEDMDIDNYAGGGRVCQSVCVIGYEVCDGG